MCHRVAAGAHCSWWGVAGFRRTVPIFVSSWWFYFVSLFSVGYLFRFTYRWPSSEILLIGNADQSGGHSLLATMLLPKFVAGLGFPKRQKMVLDLSTESLHKGISDVSAPCRKGRHQGNWKYRWLMLVEGLRCGWRCWGGNLPHHPLPVPCRSFMGSDPCTDRLTHTV